LGVPHRPWLLTNVDVFRIQFSEFSKLSGDRADALRWQMLGYVHRIADLIDAGQKDGTFVDVPPVTQTLLILSMCNGTTEWYSGTQSHMTIDELADYAARVALSGAMGAGPGPLPA
jgi:TetR/AcrR family transcriptional regulator, cholesterol catabolism regulator